MPVYPLELLMNNAIAEVTPSIFPDSFPKLASPLIMKKTIINGIVNPKNWPKISLNVTMIRIRNSGATKPTAIPKITPISNFTINFT